MGAGVASPPPERGDNVLDVLAAAAEQVVGLRVVAKLSHHPGRGDVLLHGVARDGRGAAVAAALMELDVVQTAAVGEDGALVSVCVEPAWLEDVGARLEAGRMPVTRAGGSPGGAASYVIDFCNPNATKALHVGHLRNVALGHALASAARASGAHVVTQSHIGDTGRSMGEAMAGYERFGLGVTPQTLGVKSDQFVGDCYARYLASGAERALTETADVDLAREGATRQDRPEELLARLARGDQAAVEMHRRLATWAVDGHAESLARLNIKIDRLFWESDYRDRTAEFVRRALRRGLARRSADGAVVVTRGHDEHPRLLLQRSDGFATQHARFLATWDANAEVLRETTSVEVIGAEWITMTTLGAELLERLAGTGEAHPSHFLVHGMVSTERGLVKSSAGGAWLMDELLDELAERAEVKQLLNHHERVDRDGVLATIVLGYFLSAPAIRSLSLSRERLLSIRSNPGLLLARAWVQASNPVHDDEPDPLPADVRYRHLVLRSQGQARMIAAALTGLDPLPLMRYWTHVARSFLARDPSSREARVARTLLGEGLASLGLVSASSWSRAGLPVRG